MKQIKNQLNLLHILDAMGGWGKCILGHKQCSLQILILIFSICTGIAQNKSYNLNNTVGRDSKDISILTQKSAITFRNAQRFRELSLNPIIQNAEIVRVNDTILLDLFSDKQYKATVYSTNVDINGTFSIRAKLIDFDYSYCVITTSNGKSFMTIEVPENSELYLLNYNDQTNSYYLLQIDKSKQKALEGAPSLIPPANPEMNSNSKKKIEDDSLNLKSSKTATVISKDSVSKIITQDDPFIRDTITVMIVYTPSAAAWAGTNEAGINNTIGLLMAKAQLALDNSNTLITFKLVHTEQVNYTELNTDADIYNLTNTDDGYMDNVHSLRTAYCADLVVLLENVSFTGGIAWLLDSATGDPDHAFSLIRVQQASWTYTTIHEMGHNMGCSHHKLQNFQPGPGLYSYSAGWRWTGNSNVKYCSVMTYESGLYFTDGINATQVPYFSNPDIKFQGVAVGDSVDADNARTLRQTRSVVAGYRVGCNSAPPTSQASSLTSSSLTDHSMTVGWTRGNGTSVLVVAREGNAVGSDPVSGLSYTASATFGSGSQIGTGNYVVYNGTGSSVDLTQLTAGTTYYFAIYEYNLANYNYLVPSLTGNATTTGIAPYCKAGSLATTEEYISKVEIGSIAQVSGRGIGGYQDYTSQVSTMQIGRNDSVKISVTNPYRTDQILIWIDWNQDNDFADAGENVYSSRVSPFTSPHTSLNFSPPVGATIGTTRMRIRLHDSADRPNTTPCGNSGWGEVEDYGINVIAACIPPVAPAIGLITQLTYTLATGSVVLNGLPGTGIWTLTRIPGGTTATGTGTSFIISGLATGTYTFTVTNDSGCTSVESTNVVIDAQPQLPIANAGLDQSVNEGVSVTLDGSASHDPGENPLTYLWTAPVEITLDLPTTSHPAFIAPEVSTDTSYTFSLVMNNGIINSHEDQVVVTVNNIPVIRAVLTVYLEGFYNEVSGLMNTTLNDRSLMPLSQPYTVTPWNYSGGEAVTSIPADVVDWVLVELRQATNANLATSATILAKRAAFLTRNGRIADLDGISPLSFVNYSLSGGNNLYVVIHHRNHLSIMSATSAELNNGQYHFDFTTGIARVYGAGKGYKQVGSVFAMVAGDIDKDGNIYVSDYNKWAAGFGTATGYFDNDLDMDGNSYITDYNKWASNFGTAEAYLKSIPTKSKYFSCVPK